jgi:hypothetical protein
MLVLTQMGFIPKDAKWYLADIVEEIPSKATGRNVEAPPQMSSALSISCAWLS